MLNEAPSDVLNLETEILINRFFYLFDLVEQKQHDNKLNMHMFEYEVR